MRILDPFRARERVPSLDEVDFKSLYRKSTYEVETADHWTLVITRYQALPQPFEQPLLGEPLLLVHGFSQNRHAWTCGKFVKHLLLFGADIHILELRGHGKSSVRLQRRKAAEGHRLPDDVEFEWDIDSHFLFDLPAAVAAVKRITRRDSIFYVGHSMGGMLGYGYAGLHDDLAGLITIGAPADLGKDFLPLRALAYMTPLSLLVDAGCAVLNRASQTRYQSGQLMRALLDASGARSLCRSLPPPRRPERLAFRAFPTDRLLKIAEQILAHNYRWFDLVWPHLGFFPNPARVAAADIRWLLREGGEPEPRKVVEEFARWIRTGELTCYRTGYDYKRGFANIDIPIAIIFGDMDRLASVESTRAVYRAARSEYLLWRPVKGNSHVELTMGHDIAQICYDVKNLIEYARGRQRDRARPARPQRPAAAPQQAKELRPAERRAGGWRRRRQDGGAAEADHGGAPEVSCPQQ